MSPQLFRIIATFILAYLIFRVFTAWVLPMIARWYINRYRKKFYRQNPGARKAEERRGKGKVRITYSGNAAKTNTDDIGEYVDYEEVKKQNNNTEQNP